MIPRVYALLVHYPVTDRRGDVVATSVTTLDIHDIARSARTYGLAGYFVVTPVEAQHWLVKRITQHWNDEWGSAYNPNRKDALQVIRLARDIGEAAAAITSETGQEPVWVGTSAKPYPNSTTFANLRRRMEQEPARPWCLLFGTGWGLHPEVMAEADLVLEPIVGPSEYNHLSVRSAAAIVFDRLLGFHGSGAEAGTDPR